MPSGPLTKVRSMRAPNIGRRALIVVSTALAVSAGCLLGAGSAAAQIDTTTTSVTCSPNPVPAGSASTCTATVSDPVGLNSLTGTVTFSSSESGSFTGGGSCTLPSGSTTSCAVSYTQGTPGSPTITASYGGDSGTFVSHEGSSGQTQLQVLAPTSTSVSCSPGSVVLGQATTCTATVSDTSAGTASTPTGSVSFSSDSSGSFSSGGSCILAATGTTGVAACQASYTPTAAGSGTHTITASYGGDSGHATSSGMTTVGVGARATLTSVSCSPGSVVLGRSTTCTATVSDTSAGMGSTPTGSVSFSSSSGGSFSSGGSCMLAATSTTGVASCLVAYTPSAVGSGTHTITASYGGDPTHAKSSGQTTVGVSATPACSRTLTGSVNGGLTVPAGQTYCLNGARVNGGLTVSPGAAVVIGGGSSVNGGLSSEQATFVQICASTINGSTSIQHGSGTVIIGDAGDDGSPSCAGNHLNGSVTVSYNTARVELGANAITGPVTVNHNQGSDFDDPAAGPEIESNHITGSLGCSANTPPATNDGHKNTVNGPETGECAGF